MRYRELGGTGLKVSVIGLGTWQFGGEWGRSFGEAEAAAILVKARDLGINLIDTAECYGPDHLSESLIGRCLPGRREDWIIATKFGHRFTAHNQRDFAWSPAEVTAQLEGSLRALRTDYVDLYQFHSGGDADYFREDLWSALQAHVRSGKIRHLGVSISSQGENLAQVEAAPRFGVSAVQLVYNRLDQGPEARVLPACARLNLGALARVPLASGYLSGKYRPGHSFPADDVRASHDPAKAAARIAKALEIARDEVPPGMDMARWALAWCLRRPEVTAVIPGAKDPAQVERNAAAAEVEWPPASGGPSAE
jgi:aryl-alcohol dehydrogenase-like predicted oxidoreductase